MARSRREKYGLAQLTNGMSNVWMVWCVYFYACRDNEGREDIMSLLYE
jgi:hypothetical protein